MLILGCDFHSRFQQVAMLDPTTGEVIKRRLEHEMVESPSPSLLGRGEPTTLSNQLTN